MRHNIIPFNVGGFGAAPATVSVGDADPSVLAPCDGTVVTGRTAGVLSRIVEPEVHLVIWERAVSGAVFEPRIADWDMIGDIDEDIAVATLRSTIPALLTAAGYPDALALATDVIGLAERFAAIMACAHLRIRLDVIETDACRKFHADAVTVRLLVPLVGPGTQWRRAGGETAVADGELRIGDVGLFKGRLWAEHPAILHRSPPVAGTGITRLLLVVDPLGDGHHASATL